MTSDPKPELRKIFELWMDSELKLQVVVFFHNNPGVVETMEGLARRLGTNVEVLRKEIADHIRMGILTERPAGDKMVLVYNRENEDDVRAFIARTLSVRK